MKKHLISAILAILISLALLPAAAYADELELNTSTPPGISQLEICQEVGSAWLQVKVTSPSSVRSTIELLEFLGKEHYISNVQLSISVSGGAWQQLDMTRVGSGSKMNGTWRTENISGLETDSWVQVKARYTGVNDSGDPVLSNWSDILSINEPGENSEERAEDEQSEPPVEPPFEFNAHDWAKAELAEADGVGLIPASLRSADLKEPITRAEFAAVSVKVYEALSGLVAEPAAENPFTDTSDPEVLKALHVGITNGLSETEFAPDKLLNREQAATMLSRVYKKVAFEGWTLGTDGDFAEAFRALFTMPEAFTDDADISSWARDSVYFMAANGILKGMEGGTFQPRAVTEEQQAAGYAQATREQAILIGVRLVKNLGG